MSARHVHRFEPVEIKRLFRPTRTEFRCECGMTSDEHLADLERQLVAVEDRVLLAHQRYAEAMADLSGLAAQARATVEESTPTTNPSEAP